MISRLSLTSLTTRRGLLIISTTGVLLFVLLSLSHPTSRAILTNHLPQTKAPWYRVDPDTKPIDTKEAAELLQLPLPDDYSGNDGDSEFCAKRFSPAYLEAIRDHRIQYCENPAAAALTCFHSHTTQDNERDSLCVLEGARLQDKHFALDCTIRTVTPNETAAGLIPFASIRSYWYETGPRYIFDNYVKLADKSGDQTSTQVKSRYVSTRGVQHVRDAAVPRRFTLLLKREGESNPWHCIMEIFSMSMTFDIMQMARNPNDENRPFFNASQDIAQTQVVILDKREDGPFFDLWKLYSSNAPVRLSDVAKDPALEADLRLGGRTTIVPLAGASNPMWQNDWEVRDCAHADLLRTFVGRVVRHYDVSSVSDKSTYPEGADIRITFVDRKDSRRLVNQASLLAALQERYGATIVIDQVDFATISFAEQIRTAQNTDVLVGIHGAGLTNAMFMRQGAGVVEILPSPMGGFRGFRNLANMMGLGYYNTHATTLVDPKQQKRGERDSFEASAYDVADPERRYESTFGARAEHRKRQDWHYKDVEIDTTQFVDLVGVAIRSLYNKGLRSHDVV